MLQSVSLKLIKDLEPHNAAVILILQFKQNNLAESNHLLAYKGYYNIVEF